jgi:Hypoxia induced protein conserved region
MSMMTLLVIVAALCVVGSLALGVASMVSHGEVGHRTSAQWMTMRVAFQALALGLILLAVWTG